MKISSISDIHMSEEESEREVILCQFLEDTRVLSSDYIILNGDIFDYAVGYRPSYFNRYKLFFKALKRILLKKIKVVFIEGNHDLHLKKTFHEFCKRNNLDERLFIYCPQFFQIRDGDTEFYFSHGDEIQGVQKSYLKYKKIIRSTPLKIVAHLIPLFLFDYLAKKASKKSREKSSRYAESMRGKMRENVLSMGHKGIIVLGHSHILDEWEYADLFYFNVGFFPKTKVFFHYNGKKPSLVKINAQKSRV